MNISRIVILINVLMFLSACYRIEHPEITPIVALEHESKVLYQKSGTILVSRTIPAQIEVAAVAGKHRLMMPLIGYIPPSTGFLPADNETWLEVDSSKKTITLFRGKAVVTIVQAEGAVSAAPGLYALQHKEKDPVWYAADEYFTKRQITPPSEESEGRYLRGALGSYALFPTDSFAIHSAVVWTSDVGGLKVARADLAKLFYMLPLGSSIIIK